MVQSFCSLGLGLLLIQNFQDREKTGPNRSFSKTKHICNFKVRELTTTTCVQRPQCLRHWHRPSSRPQVHTIPDILEGRPPEPLASSWWPG